MSAYVIVEVDVTDAVGYEEYKALAAPTVKAYGGKYIARGGRTENFEGDWNPRRIVLLEFENARRAREWYDSPEYAVARPVRQRTAASTRMIVVEGV